MLISAGRVLAQVELDFNSVERIVEYLEVPQEAPAVIEQKRPPAAWPTSNGTLDVQNLVVKYAPHLPEVLKSLSFHVNPAEKIGIVSHPLASRLCFVVMLRHLCQVGRTGSGKSTLAMSLLRIIEPVAGNIMYGLLSFVPPKRVDLLIACSIDGIDITTIGLEDLRSRIVSATSPTIALILLILVRAQQTIISQDVSLFSGTLRSNLDPFDEHSDQECWDVLERCHLTTVLQGSLQRSEGPHEIKLDMPISQTGSLSAGERQLVAMARAILRRSNVVILDEATSQIDSDLDDQVRYPCCAFPFLPFPDLSVFIVSDPADHSRGVRRRYRHNHCPPPEDRARLRSDYGAWVRGDCRIRLS